MDSDPPFHETYKTLFDTTKPLNNDWLAAVEELELPSIDLSRLSLDSPEKERCKNDIARAANEWGFFQVVNHGISRDVLEKMRDEQVKVFKQPFQHKCREVKFMKESAGSYRWGTPTATCLSQLSWSEAFHIPMTDISCLGDTTFRYSLFFFLHNLETMHAFILNFANGSFFFFQFNMKKNNLSFKKEGKCLN